MTALRSTKVSSRISGSTASAGANGAGREQVDGMAAFHWDYDASFRQIGSSARPGSFSLNVALIGRCVRPTATVIVRRDLVVIRG